LRTLLKSDSIGQIVNAEIRTKTDRCVGHPQRFDPRESQRSIWRNQEDAACGGILCRRCAWVSPTQRWWTDVTSHFLRTATDAMAHILLLIING